MRNKCRSCGKDCGKHLVCSDECFRAWLGEYRALKPRMCAGDCGHAAVGGTATCGQIACVRIASKKTQIKGFHKPKEA